MADPLTGVVDRVSPAPSNYFDPVPGASIISRYGNAGRGMEDTTAMAESATRLRQARDARLQRASEEEDRKYRAEQQRLAIGRDQREAEKDKREQDALEAQGDFIKRFASIDAETEDYPKAINELMSEMSPEVLQGEAIKSILAANEALYFRWATENRQSRGITQRAEEARKVREERSVSDAASKGLDVSKYPRNTEGRYDEETLRRMELDATLAERDYLAEKDEKKASQRRTEMILRNQLTQQASEKTKSNRKELESLVANPDVFPRQVSALVKGYKMNEDQLEVKYPAELAAAKDYDADTLGSEMGSALKYSKQAYRDLVTGLNEGQKLFRDKVWDLAQYAVGRTPAPAPTPGTPAPAAPAAPAAPVAPAAPTRRTVKGVTYEKDGNGWRKVSPED